jgi:hypothetical protein
MNEFLNTGKARREFALTADELNSRRTKQLNAAKVALNALLRDGGVIA